MSWPFDLVGVPDDYAVSSCVDCGEWFAHMNRRKRRCNICQLKRKADNAAAMRILQKLKETV